MALRSLDCLILFSSDGCQQDLLFNVNRITSGCFSLAAKVRENSDGYSNN